ncbi:MAG: hypothetical protein ACJ8M4_00615 [Chthoniobacterales bacterium]
MFTAIERRRSNTSPSATGSREQAWEKARALPNEQERESAPNYDGANEPGPELEKGRER